MDSHPSARPILQHGRFNKTRSRKYGRYDFERFDHISSSHANIGHEVFDKVNVNCRFLFKKSKWGVLGENKNPAGIIYLDLDFDQPKDCQLHSATIIVTLEDENEDLESMKTKLAGWKKTDFDCPVQITDCYGPKGFTGQEKVVTTKKLRHLTPSAEFSGIGFGGLGMDKETNVTHTSRWKFSGHLLPGKGNHWAYKSLKWDLSENELEAQSTHSNQVHTAFTFEHSGQPFFMRVEIKGKLKKLNGRVKDMLNLKKFPSSSKANDTSVVTLINFGERSLFKVPLDEKARELEFEMEMANMNAILMEVSDPKQANFLNVSNAYGLPNSPVPSMSWNQQQTSIVNAQQQTFLQNSAQGQQFLQTSPQPQYIQAPPPPPPITSATDPTIANLTQAFANLHEPERLAQQNQRREDAILASAPTAPNTSTIIIEEPESELESDEETAHEREPTMSLNTQEQDKLSEEQLLIQLLRMPGLLAFLRMIAVLTGLLGFLSQTPSSSSASSEVASDEERGRPRVKISGNVNVNTNANGSAAKPAVPRRDMLLEAAAAEQEDLVMREIRQTRAAIGTERQKERVVKKKRAKDKVVG